MQSKLSKFDVVVTNPPYQSPQRERKGKGRSGSTLWPRFVDLAFKLCKTDGYVCAVHPSSWREPYGTFVSVNALLQSKQLLYLSLHDRNAGIRTFKSHTSFDFYVARNKNCAAKTTVRQTDHQKVDIYIQSTRFIANYEIEHINSLIAKDGEEKCELIHSFSAYDIRAQYIKNEKSKEFCYPTVYTIGMDNNINLKYSSRNDLGKFNRPKVIFSNGTSGVCIDYEGEYLLTPFAYGIVDEKQNLESIAKALQSVEFIRLMDASALLGKHRYNYKVISLLRKDFYLMFK